MKRKTEEIEEKKLRKTSSEKINSNTNKNKTTLI
jgi:hypothetical protein